MHACWQVNAVDLVAADVTSDAAADAAAEAAAVVDVDETDNNIVVVGDICIVVVVIFHCN